MATHSQLPQSPSGSVTVIPSPDRVQLILRGELDMAMKTELLDAVREASLHDAPAEVDVRDVTFMDSSALAALSRLISISSHRPRFINPPPVVSFLLDVTRLGEMVDIIGPQASSPAPAEESSARSGGSAPHG